MSEPSDGQNVHVPCYHFEHLMVLNREVRDNAINRAVDFLSQYDFDAIAFRGVSGALVAPTVAFLMGKTLIVSRKQEPTHSTMTVEGDIGARNYIIVDDFVASGDTVRAIFDDVKRFNPKCECLGVFQYDKAITPALVHIYGRPHLIPAKRRKAFAQAI